MSIWNRFCSLFDGVHPTISDDFLPLGDTDITSTSIMSASSDSLFDDPILDDSSFSSSSFETEINPANGLPMIGGIGGIDLNGNLYGMTGDDFSPFPSSTDIMLSDSTTSDFFSSFDSDSFSGDW